MTDFATRRTMMVDTQVRPSDVTKFPIIDAMLNIAREDFVPAAMREASYLGENLNIGPNRVILEPRTLSKMLDTLDVSNGDLILDVAANYGYSSAVMAHIAEAVVAVEEDEAMSQEAQEALSAAGIDNVAVHVAPLVEGAPQHGPYDVIILQGGVAQIPDVLLDQLKEGGRIAAIFMDGPLGEVRIGLKQEGRVTWRLAFNAGAPILPGFARALNFTL